MRLGMGLGVRLGMALSMSLGMGLAGCAIEPVQSSADRAAAGQGAIASAVVEAALAEWRRWGRFDVTRARTGETCVPMGPDRCEAIDDGCGREQSARWCAIVNEYWAQAFIGSGRWFFHDCSRTDICEARWPAGVEPVRTPAWSAAFVSAVMQRAGLDDARFPRTPYHVDYVLAARAGGPAAYRLAPVPAPVAPGSLICWRRLPLPAPLPLLAAGGETGPVSASPASPAESIVTLRASRDARGPTPMHCDIVVEIDRAAGLAWAIGGNVQQSVSRLAYRLDEAGRVAAVADAVSSPLLVMTPADSEPADSEPGHDAAGQVGLAPDGDSPPRARTVRPSTWP